MAEEEWVSTTVVPVCWPPTSSPRHTRPLTHAVASRFRSGLHDSPVGLLVASNDIE